MRPAGETRPGVVMTTGMTYQRPLGAARRAGIRGQDAVTDKPIEERIMDESKAYNPPLLFLAGLLTFCLGVIAAVFSAIDKTSSAHFPLLGPVLAWTAVTALVGTIAVAVLQIARSRGGKSNPPPKGLVCCAVILPIVPGVVMVVACLRLGASIAGGKDFWSGLMSVFGF